MKNIILLTLLILGGCKDTFVGKTQYKAERVFLRDTNDFTVLIKDGTELKELTLQGITQKQVFMDVPDNEPMYVTVETWHKVGETNVNYVKIHIHQPSEINGAAFITGKSHLVSTTPVE